MNIIINPTMQGPVQNAEWRARMTAVSGDQRVGLDIYLSLDQIDQMIVDLKAAKKTIHQRIGEDRCTCPDVSNDERDFDCPLHGR